MIDPRPCTRARRLVLALGVALTPTWGPPARAADPPPVVEVSRGPLVSRLSFHGELEAARSVPIHAPDIADLLSRTSLALALGESQHTPAVFGATAPGGEQRIACRRIVRVRLINHLRKEKGCSRSVARKAVDSLTERQIDEACGTPPAAGPGDWLATLWQYITDHWPQILAALLPLLLMLI